MPAKKAQTGRRRHLSQIPLVPGTRECREDRTPSTKIDNDIPLKV